MQVNLRVGPYKSWGIKFAFATDSAFSQHGNQCLRSSIMVKRMIPGVPEVSNR